MSNVLMILDAEFPPDPRVENEAETLMSQGHTVHLMCFGYNVSTDEFFDYNGIKVHRKKCPKYVYKLSALAYTVPFYHWITARWIKQILKEVEVDVIHVHDIQIYRAAKWANVDGIPLVLDLHENRPEIMKSYSHVQSLMGRLLISPNRWKKHEYRAIREVYYLIVVTEEAKTYYVDELDVSADKIISLPNSVRYEFYSKEDLQIDILNKFRDNYVILYVGDTGIRRGLLTAIEAVYELKEKITNIKLVIVGSNKSDGILKERVDELLLEDYISFEGWQNFETFPAYIASSHICISPLYRNIHHDTTYANKIFQYMSMGKPVIVSDCPAQAHVIEKAKSGIVFEAENTVQLAEAILELNQNPDRAKEMGENGKVFVSEDFSWEKTSKSFVNLYKILNNEL
ncbi:MAG: glycosyltransferase family 4 protein [Reichenbachiella sp.]|uniref:glycosyltransferase family 4 protein n=2 Tax=Reichenbachiella sp. TaxID=2184521 RepID=UPI003297571E